VDVIIRGFREVHEFWANSIQIAIAAWLLSTQIGFAAVGPVIVCVGTLALTLAISPLSSRYMGVWMGRIQKRIGR